MSKRFFKTLSAAVIAVSFLLGAAHSNAQQSADSAVAAHEIQRVNQSEVCMINNTVMGKTQIPVTVDGKTYYGCCAGCASKLKKSQQARTAKDPLTGKDVDKAAAFITKAPDGSAMYFESADTARRFYSAQNKN